LDRFYKQNTDKHYGINKNVKKGKLNTKFLNKLPKYKIGKKGFFDLKLKTYRDALDINITRKLEIIECQMIKIFINLIYITILKYYHKSFQTKKNFL